MNHRWHCIKRDAEALEIRQVKKIHGKNFNQNIGPKNLVHKISKKCENIYEKIFEFFLEFIEFLCSTLLIENLSPLIFFSGLSNLECSFISLSLS